MAGLVVLEVDDRLPCAGHAEGVAVALDEAVDEVDTRVGILDPCYRVVVEGLEVACAVELDELFDDGLLRVVLGILCGLLEQRHHAGDGGRVVAVHLIYLLYELAVLLGHAGVEAPRHGGEVGGVLAGVIVCLDLGLGHAGGIEVVGRGDDEVLAGCLVDALGHHGGVEDDGHQLVKVGGAQRVGQGGGTCGEELLRELGGELVHRIVVMYAVGKFYLLQIELKPLVVGAVPVAVIVGIDILDEVADGQVVAAVLVPEYVAAGDGGLGEIVDEDALARGEFLEAGHFVAQHLDVCKTIHGVVEIIGLCGGILASARRDGQHRRSRQSRND